MAVDTHPVRELRSQRVVRQAVGRHMTRTICFCALSLLAGVAIGNFLVREQLQLQQGVVGQLQHEIRGLTSDIQRMELASSRSIARFENTLSRLEATQRFELSGEARVTQERLQTLERMVQRQVTATKSAQSACLAEFEPYRRKSLAVPVDLIAEALERLTQGRSADLGVLAEELRSHVENEKARLAILEQSWHLSAAPPVHSQPVRRTRLSDPLPGFALVEDSFVTPEAGASGPVAVVEAGPLSTAESRVSVSIAAPTATVAAVPTVDLRPIPDAPPPALRSAGETARTHKPRPYLLSFASGRRVESTPPSGRTITGEAAVNQTAVIESTAAR